MEKPNAAAEMPSSALIGRMNSPRLWRSPMQREMIAPESSTRSSRERRSAVMPNGTTRAARCSRTREGVTCASVRALAALLTITLAACAGSSRAPSGAGEVPSSVADYAATQAVKMVGRPYKYGGSSPSGFDCSGLVLYSYLKAGFALPRDTERQRLAARPIKVSSLRRGDLLFFDQEGKKNSHVGIYLGDGQFVHAPSSGKNVRRDRLDAYWKKHLSEARRVAA